MKSCTISGIDNSNYYKYMSSDSDKSSMLASISLFAKRISFFTKSIFTKFNFTNYLNDKNLSKKVISHRVEFITDINELKECKKIYKIFKAKGLYSLGQKSAFEALLNAKKHQLNALNAPVQPENFSEESVEQPAAISVVSHPVIDQSLANLQDSSGSSNDGEVDSLRSSKDEIDQDLFDRDLSLNTSKLGVNSSSYYEIESYSSSSEDDFFSIESDEEPELLPAQIVPVTSNTQDEDAQGSSSDGEEVNTSNAFDFATPKAEKEDSKDSSSDKEVSEDSCSLLNDSFVMLPENKSTVEAEEPGYVAQGVDAVNAVPRKIANLFWQVDDPKVLKWKIERYEAILQSLQVNYNEYFNSELNMSFAELAEWAGKENFPAGLKELNSIFALFAQDLKNIDENRLNKSYLNETRDKYNQFILSLRAAADWASAHQYSENQLHREWARRIDHLSFILYTSTDLNNQCEQIMNEIAPNFDGNEELTITEQIQFIQDAIVNAPAEMKMPRLHSWLNSAKGEFNSCCGQFFDPNTQSNPIHVFFEKEINDCGDIYRVKNLAFGSPTQQTHKGPIIVPEMRSAMRHYEKNGLKHLYINNQNHIPVPSVKFFKGCESPRCRAIHSLNENFSNTFYAITLSQNSHFHKTGYGKNELRTQNPSAVSFKTTLLQEVFDLAPEVSGNSIPESVREVFREKNEGLELREWSKELANKIHETAFNDKADLTQLERRIFIRLFYRHLVQKILLTIKPYSYNESCKDRIDRGAASDAEEFARMMIAAETLNDQNLDIEEFDNLMAAEAIDDLETENYDQVLVKFLKLMLFVRAFIVRKREPIDERVERLIETLQFMLENRNKVQALHQWAFPDVTMSVDPTKLFN